MIAAIIGGIGAYFMAPHMLVVFAASRAEKARRQHAGALEALRKVKG